MRLLISIVFTVIKKISKLIKLYIFSFIQVYIFTKSQQLEIIC